ncbi:hypothetical protein CIB93_14205 [Streptomyces sp. WZ.A104]|uniref:ParB/RepB/Spo0J family partition protein n=1 Tax=Streptomyces sp. WZ.A104 TaxID=2023771 RepID=UPI000BBCC33B|nr:ParB N-terminal domain-containing protein [Streptomyces sp. WZ.A104]PCG85502.1 hypothetical protein CIB93_14205 [Streptomyces sp. WZ.A104]
MPTTITAEADQAMSEAIAHAQPAFTGRFAWVDPYDLVIDPYNHRRHHEKGQDDGTEPDADLIASVEEVGVQSLLLLRPQTGDNEGRLGIIFGQRRNKAAIIAADKAKAEGRPYTLVPALIRDDLRGVDDEALALSVIENKHRTDPHHRDYIEAARQLSLMELPTATKDRHARALGLSREELTAAERAAQLDDTALREAVAADFDLIELADYQEVQHLNNARWTLERAKSRDLRENNDKRGHWAHAMNDLRQKKEDQAKRLALKADITAAGITLIEHSWRDTPARPLTDLLTELGKPMTPDTHTRCPGHAAALHPSEPEIIWLCADWKKNRHELNAASSTVSPSGMSEAEKEARRRTIRYNKAWRAARTVRQEFIADMCETTGDASPATWALILNTITGTSTMYARYVSRHSTDLVSAFLKIDDPNEDAPDRWNRVQNPFAPLIARTGKTRRWRLLLAQVAATYESEAMHDGMWQHPDSSTVAWLTFLKVQGYALSDIEDEVLALGHERTGKPLEGSRDEEAQKEQDEQAAA